MTRYRVLKNTFGFRGRYFFADEIVEVADTEKIPPEIQHAFVEINAEGEQVTPDRSLRAPAPEVNAEPRALPDPTKPPRARRGPRTAAR